MDEKEKDLVKRLRENSAKLDECYADKKMILGLHLLRWKDDCEEAADRIEQLEVALGSVRDRR